MVLVLSIHRTEKRKHRTKPRSLGLKGGCTVEYGGRKGYQGIFREEGELKGEKTQLSDSNFAYID